MASNPDSNVDSSLSVPSHRPAVQIIVVIGVSGSGKTTIGEELAKELGWPFFDADEFHPKANIEKMSHGTPLTDEDRWPWLANIRAKMESVISADGQAVFACSALKEIYRQKLIGNLGPARLVYLFGDFQTIKDRMLKRKNHFMKAGMLESQFASLEEPKHPDCRVSIDQEPKTIIAEIRRQLGL